MIKFLIHFFSLTNVFISFLLVSLVVLALFIFSLQDKTSFLPKPRNASSWATPDFRRVIVVFPLRLIDTFSLLMSLSLRTHPSSSPSLFLLLKSYPFPSSPRLYLMLYLLDHFRFIVALIVLLFLSLPSVEAPADSLPIPSASPTPTLLLADNLPIALRKGNRSISNAHSIYNFLSYHRLSSPYHCLSLSHPGQRHAMVDEMAALHLTDAWDLVV